MVTRLVGIHPSDHRFGDATGRHIVDESIGEAQVREVIQVDPNSEQPPGSGNAVQLVEGRWTNMSVGKGSAADHGAVGTGRNIQSGRQVALMEVPVDGIPFTSDLDPGLSEHLS